MAFALEKVPLSNKVSTRNKVEIRLEMVSQEPSPHRRIHRVMRAHFLREPSNRKRHTENYTYMRFSPKALILTIASPVDGVGLGIVAM
jgi:hypothetical protein